MGLYRTYLLPTLTELAMRNRRLRPERERWVSLARGAVLEVGVGSGLNLPIYGREVRKLYALDPSEELLRMARSRAARAAVSVEFLCRPAAAIPLADGSVDDVVTTWTLCTIPDPVAALQEMRRVLRPAGRLIFVEHGRSPDPAVVRWQDRLTPLWRRVAGGCHLNRPIDLLLRSGGFEALAMDRGYVAGPRVGSYLYRGIARAAGGQVSNTDTSAEKGSTHAG
ncbi:MAG TPA: methyltransferase domain-containing protein [Candidatus Limnocylindria bacterium]|nr:methyltransferase domain-containing protein [Candidatus Limnocylindria bacterium]